MWKVFSKFFEKFVNPKTTAPKVETISWSDILKPRKQYKRSMLMPSRCVSIWRSEEFGNRKLKNGPISSLSVMFKVFYENEEFLIKTQRNLEQKVRSEGFPKISHLIHKKIHGNKAETSESVNFVSLSPESSEYVNENTTMADFLEDNRIQSILVNNEEFRIVRNGVPIQAVHLNNTPLVGFHCTPTVSFNQPSPRNELICHWFVKNSPEPTEKPESSKIPSKKPKNAKKIEETLNISFENEENRKFLVENYTFRGKSLHFSPKIEDVNRKLAVLVESHPDHPVYGAISMSPIARGPEEVITDEQLDWCRRNRIGESEIRVMCYNILADLYLNLNMEQNELFFKYCEKPYQKVAYRTPILLKQIADFASSGVSLFFLQEVDVSRHENFLAPFLKTIGFGSTIAKKLYTINEGVAIVFDEKKYRLISTEQHGLAQLTEEETENEDVRRILKTSSLAEERFMSRPTVVQIVILEEIATKTILLCGNTHLHHNPKEEHIKVLQSLVSIRKILQIHRKQENKERIRILFGGDFNSTPDGAVFELMSTGNLPSTDNVWKLDESIKPENLSIDYRMKCLSGTPEYTNYTRDSDEKGFVGCLDYLWGIGASEVRQCPMPNHSKVIKYTALPSPISSSDHLPIITDIKI